MRHTVRTRAESAGREAEVAHEGDEEIEEEGAGLSTKIGHEVENRVEKACVHDLRRKGGLSRAPKGIRKR